MRRFRLQWLVLVSGLLASGTTAFAKTRYVSPSGTDAFDCAVAPCRTIHYAVGQAAAGDTIRVAAGTYADSISVNKRLILSGSGRGSTTIDADGHDNGVVIAGAASAGTVFRGFTVKNAGREGLFANKTSYLLIADNTFVMNDAYGPNSPQCPAADPDDCGEAVHLQTVTFSAVSGNLVQNNVGGILLTDEDGPTAFNLLSDNQVLDNTKDCGITLASHFFQLGAPASASTAGVYQNLVLHNASIGNGAAGIGVFAGPPGAAAWGNVVVGNTAKNNGLPGVAMHAHSPFQNLDGNVVTNNIISGNGPDDDAGTVDPTGITVWSGVVSINQTTVAHNIISNEHYGIFARMAPKISGLPSNVYINVAVPVSQQ